LNCSIRKILAESNVTISGAVQGMITGMRGLCNGLGPAVFGVVFYLFNVDLNDDHDSHAKSSGSRATNVEKISQHVPGPPFVFGALCVFCAIIVSAFIPEGQTSTLEKKRKGPQTPLLISSPSHLTIFPPIVPEQDAPIAT